MRYLASADFVVGSRMSWEGREDELHQHIDAVVDELRGAPPVGAVDVDADLGKATVVMQVVFDLPRDNTDFDHDVRVLITKAITHSGGIVTNLLPISEEGRHRPIRNAWWGLRTPKWTSHTFTVAPGGGS